MIYLCPLMLSQHGRHTDACVDLGTRFAMETAIRMWSED